MCPDGTQYSQGTPDAPDATRCGAWVQDAQDAQDVESRLGESGCNMSVSDAGHLFADVVRNWLACLGYSGRGTISSDSKMGGLSCLIELSQ